MAAHCFMYDFTDLGWSSLKLRRQTTGPNNDHFLMAEVSLQDFMMAAHCFMYEFTDLGWKALDASGQTSGPWKEGFVWHTDPGCVLLPEDTRICFIRCDEFTCIQTEVSHSIRTIVSRNFSHSESIVWQPEGPVWLARTYFHHIAEVLKCRAA